MESIRVAVRIRPDEESFGESCLGVNESCKSIQISKKQYETSRSESSSYTFDNVFGPTKSQEEVFDEVKCLINESLNGFNVTLFAFGMTGSGKTFTIAGTPQNPGIVPRTVSHIFTDLQQKSNRKNSMAIVFLTYVELYNNSLYDLLAAELPDGEESGGGLKLHEHPKKGMQISGSPSLRMPVTSAEQALKLISQGNKLRSTSTTKLNDRSSRSHTVISFEIVSQDTSATSAKVGKINLVDLAGSERVKQSGAEGQSMEEAKQINLALSVLGDVLNSLSKYHQGLQSLKLSNSSAQGDVRKNLPHIPFRNSKLTMLLKDSLGGNAKTMMIATIRTSSAFYQQTMVSLRYAARARHIKCNPVQNVAVESEEGEVNVQHTLSEVSRLKAKLAHRNQESEALKARLIDLETLRMSYETGGMATSDETRQRLAKEKEYKEEIGDLQGRIVKERKELTEHLRLVIHNHEGTLAAKEKDYEYLEHQLAQQSSHLRSMNAENKQALDLKEKSDLTLLQFVKITAEQDANIAKLRSDNSVLTLKMADVIKVSNYDKVELCKSLSVMTASRDRNKRRSDELEIAHTQKTQELALSLAEKNNLTKTLSSDACDLLSTELLANDALIRELNAQLKECSEKNLAFVLELECMTMQKNVAVSEVDKYREENVLLMEQIVFLDSEWRKGVTESLKDSEKARDGEVRLKELKKKSKQEVVERQTLAQVQKALSSDLKESLSRESHLLTAISTSTDDYERLLEETKRLRVEALKHTQEVHTYEIKYSEIAERVIKKDSEVQQLESDYGAKKRVMEVEIEGMSAAFQVALCRAAEESSELHYKLESLNFSATEAKKAADLETERLRSEISTMRADHLLDSALSAATLEKEEHASQNLLEAANRAYRGERRAELALQCEKESEVQGLLKGLERRLQELKEELESERKQSAQVSAMAVKLSEADQIALHYKMDFEAERKEAQRAAVRSLGEFNRALERKDEEKQKLQMRLLESQNAHSEESMLCSDIQERFLRSTADFESEKGRLDEALGELTTQLASAQSSAAVSTAQHTSDERVRSDRVQWLEEKLATMVSKEQSDEQKKVINLYEHRLFEAQSSLSDMATSLTAAELEVLQIKIQSDAEQNVLQEGLEDSRTRFQKALGLVQEEMSVLQSQVDAAQSTCVEERRVILHLQQQLEEGEKRSMGAEEALGLASQSYEATLNAISSQLASAQSSSAVSTAQHTSDERVLSDRVHELEEKLATMVSREQSDERETIIKEEYGKKMTVLKDQLVRVQSAYTQQTKDLESLKKSVHEKVERDESQSQSDRSEESSRAEAAVRESEILKSRIAMMVSQEKDMFSTLKERLEVLGDARSKILRLQQSATTGHKTELQLYLIADSQQVQLDLGTRLEAAREESAFMGVELKRSRDTNKGLRYELEKLTRQLALEQQKSRSYLQDLERNRKVTSDELKNTVSIVRQRVETDQVRRHTELLSVRDSNISTYSASSSRMHSRSGSRSGSASLLNDGSVDSNTSGITASFVDAMNIKHGVYEDPAKELEGHSEDTG